MSPKSSLSNNSETVYQVDADQYNDLRNEDSATSSDESDESVFIQPSGVLDAVGSENIAELLTANTYYKYDSECVRKKSNWSKTRNLFKFDTPEFDPKSLVDAIHTHSSKLESLLKKIDDLDKRDMQKDGRKYKHFIFSDIKSGLYGAKLIAGALIAKGMHLGYSAEPSSNPNSKKQYQKIILDDNDTLMKSKFNNFYLLSSIGVYDRPITVVNKKSILKTFNSRPDNVYGELARIIVMDSGYKEGIDLFDIKYIHIYEPQTSIADQKQVIGRGTRTCGQKGLEFHPTKGWPLHVFIYDVEIPEELRRQMLGSPTLFDLYMKSMNLDLRLFQFQYDLERVTVYGSVDYELNRDIHNFSIEPDPDDMMFGGGRRIVIDRRAPMLVLGKNIDAPRDFQKTRDFVRNYFSQYTWKNIQMENNCIEKKVGGANLITYTPTQDFVRNYFTPQNPVKGMLLWHSVGTGKTCSAIATASSSFERDGYTILWVTRTTLKNDIWKNMFDQICNENIRDKIENGAEIQDTQSKNMRLLTKSWSIRPMSYKQFSNLVSKQNSFYRDLVKKNGKADPLRKTLLIIDEAHKLYGGEDLSSIERPNMDALKASLQHSYIVSGKDSVRLLLMTATPITQNPMELIKLINLLKPIENQMPETFPDFYEQYLHDNGKFSEIGEKNYLDNIAGYVSYLNREKDARQFAQPIVHFVNVPLVDSIENIAKIDQRMAKQQITHQIMDLKNKVEENDKQIDKELQGVNAQKLQFLKNKCNQYSGKAKTQCEKIVREHIKSIVREAKEGIQTIKDRIKDLKDAIKHKRQKQSEILKEMKENESPETQAKIEELKNSMYYTITRQCGKKVSDFSKLDEIINNIPEIQSFDEEIIRIDSVIDSHNEQLNIALKAQKARLKQMKQIMKNGITQEERELLKTVAKEESKQHNKEFVVLKETIHSKIRDANVEKKKWMKTRKVAVKKVKQTLKNILLQKKEEAKAIAREQNAQEKLLQKQADYAYEIKNDYLKNIIETHNNEIAEELSENSKQLEELEKDVHRKQLEKANQREIKAKEKALIAETKKRQKALKDDHKKTMKNEKEAKKAEKRAIKEAEQQEKNRAKEWNKKIREQETAEKAHKIATQKLQALQQKYNKTVKKTT